MEFAIVCVCMSYLIDMQCNNNNNNNKNLFYMMSFHTFIDYRFRGLNKGNYLIFLARRLLP